jgi:hypothetical protein
VLPSEEKDGTWCESKASHPVDLLLCECAPNKEAADRSGDKARDKSNCQASLGEGICNPENHAEDRGQHGSDLEGQQVRHLCPAFFTTVPFRTRQATCLGWPTPGIAEATPVTQLVARPR